MIDTSVVRERFTAVERDLNERSRRLLAAAEAKTAGYGGITAASLATGIARSTIGRGLKDMAEPGSLSGEVRRPGGGGPTLIEKDPNATGKPASIAGTRDDGRSDAATDVGVEEPREAGGGTARDGSQDRGQQYPKMLGLLKYRRQVNRKTLEGSHNPDRNAQFEHINAAVIATQAAGQPVISIDTKKEEPIGSYKNGGSDYRQEGCPDKVNVHDFVDKELGKVAPYGVYDVTANAGCVSLGISNDTAQFAVNPIRRWRDVMGRERYPDMKQLMITAGGGGSNGSRVRLFKVELQKLADETGLTVRCELDTRDYPKGIKVSDTEMTTLNIKGDTFHPEWNYTISPRETT